MNQQYLNPLIKVVGQSCKDFELVEFTVAGLRCIDSCISVYVEKVKDAFRTVALFDPEQMNVQSFDRNPWQAQTPLL